MSKKLLILFVFSLLFFASTSSVLAQDVVWSTPVKINTSTNNAIIPVFTTDSKGYLHAAWMELNKSGVGSDFWTGLNPGVLYSYWNGDAWSTPVNVSQNTDWAGLPAITSTTDNKIHVFYEDDSANPENSYGRIMYRNTSDNGQNWSSAVTISKNISGSWSWSPQVAAGPTNNLHVIFNYNDPPPFTNDYYYTKWDGANWSTPIKISTTSNVQHATIAVDSNNLPHVLLWDADNLSGWPNGGIYYTYFNGTIWTTPTRISLTGFYPRLINDASNKLHAVWVSMNLGTYKVNVEYSRYEAGSWTSPTTITTSADFSYWGLPYTGLTYDSLNNVYVGWGERIADGTVDANYKKWNGTSWSSPVFMRNVADLDTVFVYRDKWDNQHMSWSEYNSAASEWQFYYSAIPANVASYNPASTLNMTLAITSDTLSIPAAALASVTNISAQIGPLPASADPGYTTLPRSFTYRPHGTTFAAGKEATAVIKYADAEMIGTDEKNMKLYIWDGTANAWSTSFTTSVNTGKNQATVTLPHFSLFGVMLKKVKTTWLDPLTQEKPFQLGSTIPLRFKLAYLDDSPLDPGEEVALVITNSSGKVVRQFTMGKGTENLRYEPGTGQFLATFKTKDLAEGNYQIRAELVGNLVGEKTLSLTLPKGKTP